MYKELALYEKYHSSKNAQKRIIEDWNYTYRNLIQLSMTYFMPVKSILDVGCGTGTICFYLISKGKITTGIDISKNAIEQAKVNLRNLSLSTTNNKFITGDFRNKIIKGKFDLITFFEVLEHLPDDMLAIRKISKLLKPNGILILSTRSVKSPLYRLGLTRWHDKRVGHLRRYTLPGLIKIIQDSGLHLVKISKTEGIFKEVLFTFPFFGFFIRLANKIKLVSDTFTLIDNVCLSIFDEGQILVIARNKKK